MLLVKGQDKDKVKGTGQGQGQGQGRGKGNTTITTNWRVRRWLFLKGNWKPAATPTTR